MLKINLVCGCESITFLCFIVVEQQAKYQCMMVYRYILKWTNNYWYHLIDDYIYIVYKLQIAITDESLNSCLGFLPLLFSVLYFNWEDIIQIRVQINRIPLLSVTLPIKVTIWGNQSVFLFMFLLAFFFLFWYNQYSKFHYSIVQRNLIVQSQNLHPVEFSSVFLSGVGESYYTTVCSHLSTCFLLCWTKTANQSKYLSAFEEARML